MLTVSARGLIQPPLVAIDATEFRPGEPLPSHPTPAIPRTAAPARIRFSQDVEWSMPPM